MRGPLDGVRIVDLSAQISGPLATGMLGDQGADIIKIEPPVGGDSFRFMGPQRGGMGASFLTINRNKRFLALDIGKPDGKRILWDLLRTADVLLQNFRPGVIERLGFSYEAVSAINPSIIFTSISGFGDTGPYVNRKAYDTIVQSVSGLAATQADVVTGEPQLIQSAICDKTTALITAQAISSALFARERHKERKGQHVKIAMLDTAIWFAWPEGMFNHVVTEPELPPVPEVSAYPLLFRAKNGSLGLSIVTQDEFVKTCRALGHPELGEDPRFNSPQVRFANMSAMNDVFVPLFAGFDIDDIYDRLAKEDVPVAKVNGRRDVLEDAQVIGRQIVRIQDHPQAGKIRQPSYPALFGPEAVPEPLPAGAVGQHTVEILGELGYASDEIARLLAAGSVAGQA